MKKDSIIQFVGFVTKLDFETFIPQWEEYAKEFMKVSGAKILQRESDVKNSFKYISQHESNDAGFRFKFMKGRNSEHFHEQSVKVSQAGGYIPIQIQAVQNKESDFLKVMAFISHDENDIDYYRKLSHFKFLNIYQAYFENCTYGYILEFFTNETDAPLLLEQLQTRTGSIAAIYKNCAVPQT